MDYDNVQFGRKHKGIEGEISLTVIGALKLSFAAGVIWGLIALTSTMDGTMIFVGEIQGAGTAFRIAGTQASLVFLGLFVLWCVWDILMIVLDWFHSFWLIVKGLFQFW